MRKGLFKKNTFVNGVSSDYDIQKIPENALKYSLNGRVVFNINGTLAWDNGNGNALAISLGFNYGNPGTPYKIIGVAEIQGYLVLWSTQNTVNNVTTNVLNSEIGLLTESQKGVYAYQTVFNDQYDPNGQLMHLNTRYQIKAYAILENKNTIRGYWCDDFNEDRVFNVVSGLYPITINSVPYFNKPYLPYTTQASGPPPPGGNVGMQAASVGAKYPYWYSVHGMSELCDVQFGLIKYQKNIPGSKISGARQYFYRLVHKSGYATPWSTGSGMIFLTTNAVNPTDWTQYSMSASGLTTNKGHQLEIKYIDTRFTFIEVAWAYYATAGPFPTPTAGAPLQAAIFFQGYITGTSMIISDIDENVVVPLPDPTVLAQRYTDVIHSKTKLINENYQHKGNVVLRGTLSIDTSEITIQPFLRKMLSDTLNNVNTTPITHQPPVNGLVSYNLFDGLIEQYMIGDASTNDYINYKGTQWDCLFKGEFRGQTVPYAIVLFSRKGQPFFAQHIGDFEMPDQFGNTWTNTVLDASGNPVITTGTTGNVGDYTLTDYTPGSTDQIISTVQQGNNIVLKILGKKVSGIDLTNIIFDQYGELQISGFSIVRADRVPNLITQGLIMNTTLLPSVHYINISTPPENGPLGTIGSFVLPLRSTGNAYFTGANSNPDCGDSNIAPQIQLGGALTLESPDVMLNPAILTSENNGCSVELVGACMASFLQGDSNGFSQPANPAFFLYYSKNYQTYMNINRSDQSSQIYGVNTKVAGGNFGAKYPIETVYGNIIDDTAVPLINNPGISTPFVNQSVVGNFYGTTSGGNWSQGHINTVLLQMGFPGGAAGAFFNASASTPVTVPANPKFIENNITYYIVNIITGQEQILNESIVSTRIYHGIGHFVPINATTLAAAKTVISGVTKYIFNNVEVWGGDCYADYFGYARLMPCYINPKSGNADDYGIGLVFPCETVYNQTMRTGNTFSSVFLRPGADETNPGGSPAFNTGIFVNNQDSTDARLEDFDLNAVMQASDQISSYDVENVYFVDEPDQPLFEMVSNVKFAGENYDSFRIFLINNNQLADSQYGFITDLQALGHNVYVMQEKGFGRIRFNEYTLENTANDNLTVGTGQGYQGHVYEGGAQWGCQHEWSVYNDQTNIFWVNGYMGKHNKFNGKLECLSDAYGQHNYFTTNAENYWQIPSAPLQDTNENIYDNPCDIGGISSGYDYTNGANLITFTQWKTATGGGSLPLVITMNGTPSTMEWGETVKRYQGNWDFMPPIYLSRFKQDFLTYGSNIQNLYVHNSGAKGSFYGVVYNSVFEFIANGDTELKWDNCELNIQPTGKPAMLSFTGQTENGTQTVLLNDPSDIRPEYRNGMLIFPSMTNRQVGRLTGKYCDITYVVNNTPNLDVLASGHRIYYREDHR